ncbi:hypothetical protein RI367_000400 [Sorochytrium milnesiophthora]
MTTDGQSLEMDSMMDALQRSFAAMNADALRELRELEQQHHQQQKPRAPLAHNLPGASIVLPTRAEQDVKPTAAVIAGADSAAARRGNDDGHDESDVNSGADQSSNPFSRTRRVIDKVLHHDSSKYRASSSSSIDRYLMGEESQQRFGNALQKQLHDDSAFERLLQGLDGTERKDTLSLERENQDLLRQSMGSDYTAKADRSDVLTTADLDGHGVQLQQSGGADAAAVKSKVQRMLEDETVQEISHVFADNFLTHDYERELFDEIQKQDFDKNIDLILDGDSAAPASSERHGKQHDVMSSSMVSSPRRSLARHDHSPVRLPRSEYLPSPLGDPNLVKLRDPDSSIQTESTAKHEDKEFAHSLSEALKEFEDTRAMLDRQTEMLQRTASPRDRPYSSSGRTPQARADSLELQELIRQSQQLTASLLPPVILDGTRGDNLPVPRLSPPPLPSVRHLSPTSTPASRRTPARGMSPESRRRTPPELYGFREPAPAAYTPYSVHTLSPVPPSPIHSLASLDVLGNNHTYDRRGRDHSRMQPGVEDVTQLGVNPLSPSDYPFMMEYDNDSKETLLAALKRLQSKVGELELERGNYRQQIQGLQEQLNTLSQRQQQQQQQQERQERSPSLARSSTSSPEHARLAEMDRLRDTVTALQFKATALQDELESQVRRSRQLEHANTDLHIELSQLRTRMAEVEEQKIRLETSMESARAAIKRDTAAQTTPLPPPTRTISTHSITTAPKATSNASVALQTEHEQPGYEQPVATDDFGSRQSDHGFESEDYHIADGHQQRDDEPPVEEDEDEEEESGLRRQIDLEKRLRRLIERKLERSMRRKQDTQPLPSAPVLDRPFTNYRAELGPVTSAKTTGGVRSSQGMGGKVKYQRVDRIRTSAPSLPTFPYLTKRPGPPAKKSTGKSHSVPVNLQRMFSMLKAHNPSICRNGKARNSEAGGGGGRKSEQTGSSQRGHRLSQSEHDSESIEQVIAGLEDEFRHLRMNYQMLLKEYESLNPAATAATFAQRQQLQDVSSQLRDSDQITALRQYQLQDGEGAALHKVYTSSAASQPDSRHPQQQQQQQPGKIPSAADSKLLHNLSLLKSSQRVQQVLAAGM